MKRAFFLWLITFVMGMSSSVAAPNGPVVVVPLDSEVSRAQFFFLRRALKEAERQQASAFVIEMDTYGGDVKAAIENMDALMKTTVPTYTYINPRAISAGSMISLATQQIYMSPTAVIGASAPVMGGGQDLEKTMQEKTVSMLSAMARSAAQKNGHNADIAEAFISRDKEVKMGETVIDKGDSLLTLSAEEAARKYDSKPLLARGIAATLPEMLQQAGLTGAVKRVQPTGFERLALWITMFAPVLLAAGIIGGYMEFKTPGFGVPGVISIICFALFFTGHYFAGLAGSEVAVCFAVGAALVLAELLVFPGAIIPGAVGAFLMIGAMVYAMVDRYPSQPVIPSSEMLLRPLLNVVIALIGTVIVGALLAKFLPRTSFYSRIVLADAVASGPGVTAPVAVLGVPVGTVGTAQTTLRPSGKAEFSGQLYDVVSYGTMIEAGAPVRVAQVEGLRVVVEPA
jgi:membrane-bound serine protease (ClpP class)